MALHLRALFSQFFHRLDPNLRKHLSAPRDPLLETERQIARQLKAYFRQRHSKL